ncbi:Alpha/beta hydrolase family [Shewanella psychrophila]|uniref:Alpha/beta hydrolase family n=1 Tax=Shewanella psychrophila TaxID=225848 RepID=A0A1S6HXK3_9GAMM|nr:alpha/beta fold hydrolase [Shewanella psychrophila]AQS40290.1 Alpha/beta hydrolase family [Shewanella psychrophila]
MTTIERKTALVLVHGIFNTGSVMAWMRRRFESQGFECFTPTLAPFDGGDGVESAAKKLEQQILERFGHEQDIAIVGFSMGGIVARFYLQQLGGSVRTTHLFTISSPHSGSYMAYLPYPSKTFKQLRPGSELLNLLDGTVDTLDGLSLFSYCAAIDYTVAPSRSHWPVASNKQFGVYLHMSMIFSQKVVDEILKRLES